MNVWLRFAYGSPHLLADRPAMAQFAFDIVQLTVLLFLTGGLQNPFAILFLAPVMISAASMRPRWTFVLVTLTVVAATFLWHVHLPLPWSSGQELTLPVLFTTGTWVAMLSGTTFIGFYAAQISDESRKVSDALAATELVLAREQHLSQLDGLAAAAAHELGTPLGTIAVVVRELVTLAERSGSAIPIEELRGDIELLDQELRRCRAILGKLTSLHSDTGPLATLSLSQLVEEVTEPLRHFGVAVRVEKVGVEPEPMTPRNPGVLYGLSNLVENALDFATSEVRIVLTWTRDRLSIAIQDDGAGFPNDIIHRLGDPYLTTRGADRRAKADEGAGLGLGLFIAKTLLERSGASLSLANRAAPTKGAVVTVAWPRLNFERSPLEIMEHRPYF